MTRKAKNPEATKVELAKSQEKQPEADKGDEVKTSAKPDGEVGTNSGSQDPMKTVSDWAEELVGSERWQVAAMLRLKRWADDKRVTKSEYQAAMEALLKHRPGRR